jgi:uncharacterized protein YaeQ
MALPSTLYRFRLNLSDVDRDVYKELDLRVAMHPSESQPFLLTRIIAYALNEQDGLEFAPGGLSDAEIPCISVPGVHGGVALWIEIGNPSARKLHKASKAAERLKVYTYKDPLNLLREIQANKIHDVENIEIYSLGPKFLENLAATLGRDNRWSVIHTDGSLSITVNDVTEQGELVRHSILPK